MKRTGGARAIVLATLAATLLLLGACGKSDDDSSSSTSGSNPAPPTTATSGTSANDTAKFDKAIQQQLADVGCYSGAIDGILGPETDAAIVAFQSAEGLEVDGELGPETESALSKAASSKKQVCGTGTATTTTPKTTTTTNPKDPICTASAIQPALPPNTKITSYVCSGDYAGVQGDSPGNNNPIDNTYYAILQWGTQDGNTGWLDVGQTPCTTPPLPPPAIIQVGCGPTGK